MRVVAALGHDARPGADLSLASTSICVAMDTPSWRSLGQPPLPGKVVAAFRAEANLHGISRLFMQCARRPVASSPCALNFRATRTSAGTLIPLPGRTLPVRGLPAPVHVNGSVSDGNPAGGASRMQDVSPRKTGNGRTPGAPLRREPRGRGRHSRHVALMPASRAAFGISGGRRREPMGRGGHGCCPAMPPTTATCWPPGIRRQAPDAAGGGRQRARQRLPALACCRARSTRDRARSHRAPPAQAQRRPGQL